MTPATVTSLASVMRELRLHHKHARKTVWIDGVFTLLNLCAALAFTFWLPNATTLPSLFIAWWMLRRYYSAQRRAHAILVCINRVQRVYVETTEQAREELRLLSVELAKLGLTQP